MNFNLDSLNFIWITHHLDLLSFLMKYLFIIVCLSQSRGVLD